MLTEKISDALAIAVNAHQGQWRKDATISHLAHLSGVASIALEYGADEEQAIAALLHDVLKDDGRDAMSMTFNL